jgi:tryptophanyl-tRNA synthetase
MRATGRLHLGNYLGAARDFVELDRDPEMECFFGIADLHALTSLEDPKNLRPNTLGYARDYIAAGVERSAIFLQSAVPETSELFWLLCNVTSEGKLLRSKTYKDMKERQPNNLNAGLLNYPVLMAADILGPQADLVPVGDDQMAHLEMTRDIARRFNSKFGDTFTIPAPFRKQGIRVPGLDGKAKMSASLNNGFQIAEDPKAIAKKLRKAQIDPARQSTDIPGDPGKCVVGQIHRLLPSEAGDLERVETGCTSATLTCGDCKALLATNLERVLAPIRKRSEELTDADIEDRFREGADRVRPRIVATLNKAKKRMGL